jgi:hypothetical protein
MTAYPIHVLRTGYQWKPLQKKEYMAPSGPTTIGGSKSGSGVFQKMGVRLLEIYYDDIRGIKWRWQQSLDSSAYVKAPLGERTRQAPIRQTEEARASKI